MSVRSAHKRLTGANNAVRAVIYLLKIYFTAFSSGRQATGPSDERRKQYTTFSGCRTRHWSAGSPKG